MHRKSRLDLFFHLHFPHATTTLFAESAPLAQLDFRTWLSEPPAETVRRQRIYQELTKRQDSLLTLAATALAEAHNNALQTDTLARLLRLTHEMDRAADRFDHGIVSALTDIDELTGLLNRTAMERELYALYGETGAPRPLATIAMVDADLFKQVNDEHGHAFGDHVLATLAERFLESLRPQDKVYRYGGEEFLVLLPHTPLHTALPVLQRLRMQAYSEAISDGDCEVMQSVSVGAAETGDEPLSDTIERADQALYRAKAAGRNRIETDPEPV